MKRLLNRAHRATIRQNGRHFIQIRQKKKVLSFQHLIRMGKGKKKGLLRRSNSIGGVVVDIALTATPPAAAAEIRTFVAGKLVSQTILIYSLESR